MSLDTATTKLKNPMSDDWKITVEDGPEVEASRLVSKIWNGGLTASERDRLDALCDWCATCYAYLLRGHVCWTPEISATLRAEVVEAARVDAAHAQARIDDARIADSMDAFARALAWDEVFRSAPAVDDE
jgi:hypothetical protein